MALNQTNLQERGQQNRRARLGEVAYRPYRCLGKTGTLQPSENERFVPVVPVVPVFSTIGVKRKESLLGVPVRSGTPVLETSLMCRSAKLKFRRRLPPFDGFTFEVVLAS